MGKSQVGLLTARWLEGQEDQGSKIARLLLEGRSVSLKKKEMAKGGGGGGGGGVAKR